MEFICPNPLIQMPCLGGASFSWAHSDLQLGTHRVRLEATVSFRRAELGAHTGRGSGTCSGGWLCQGTNQGTEGHFAGAVQGAQGEHRDLSQPSPPCQSQQAQLVFQQPG